MGQLLGVMIASLLLNDTMRPSLFKGSLSMMVFRCCCNHTTRCKSSYVLLTWILLYLRRTSAFLSNLLHICRFCSGSSNISPFPLDAIPYLVNCLLPYPTHALKEVVSPYPFSFIARKNNVILFFTLAFSIFCSQQQLAISWFAVW